MGLPVGRGLALSVDIINVSSPSLRTRAGHVLRHEDGLYTIQLDDDAPDLVTGGRVVLSLPRGRVSATVETREGSTLQARERSVQVPDKRVYPRLAGGIPLRYRVVDPADFDTHHAWLLDKPPVDDSWHTPDPFMNFSVTGLRFDDAENCADGDLLLCELGVPGDDRRWRALARVIRVSPISPDRRDRPVDATHHVAVQFDRLPDEAAEALTHYTLRLQRTNI